MLLLTISLAFLLEGYWDMSIYESASFALFIYFMWKVIGGLGKSIWLFLDVIILLMILTCLVVPSFFYHYYTDTNAMAVLWVKFMPIPADVYYSYTFPATLALIIGFNTPFIKRIEFKYTIKEYLNSGLLNRPNKLGIFLFLISLFATFIRNLAPYSLGFVVFLLVKLVFIGFLYLFFSGNRPDWKWMTLAAIILFVQSLQSAMFGEFIFMALLTIIIFSYGNRYSNFFKVSMILLGIFSIVLIQSLKQEYRQSVWSGSSVGTSANLALFATLASQKTQDSNAFLSEEKLFFTAVRFNQGWLVASIMKNVPAVVPFAEGETVWKSLLASITPRFLWPDKPEAGGKANLKRFLGWELRGTSMNIGLLGEAYANFGVYGGCVFLFFFGLFFQWVYNYVIRLTHHTPTLIIWMPLLFFYCIGVENDVLTVINHLTKTGFFIFILYKVFPRLFGIRL